MNYYTKRTGIYSSSRRRWVFEGLSWIILKCRRAWRWWRYERHDLYLKRTYDDRS